jgi:hypothetical protein
MGDNVGSQLRIILIRSYVRSCSLPFHPIELSPDKVCKLIRRQVSPTKLVLFDPSQCRLEIWQPSSRTAGSR